MTFDWQLEKRIAPWVATLVVGDARSLLGVVAGQDTPPGCAGSRRGDRSADEVSSCR